MDHVLTSCRMTQDARRKASSIVAQMDIPTLLYTQAGIEQTLKIWKEFEKGRKAKREEGEIEQRDRELEWGRGDLEV